MNNSDRLLPILKWVGGKRQLLDSILPFIPAENTLYVEPFVGGGAVAFSQHPKQARLFDSNDELINVYRVVRDNPQELLSQLEVHEKNNSSDYYYSVRRLDREDNFTSLSDVERAARIIYLNKTGYNGLYRVNSQGQLNVPYGRYKNPNIVNRDNILKLSAYLSQNDVYLGSGDFTEALENLPAGSFVYFDPPYVPLSETSNFTGYTGTGFSFDDQKRLRDACLRLRENGIHFVQSNSDADLVHELYKDFEIRTVQAKRAVNSVGSKRDKVNEVLILG